MTDLLDKIAQALSDFRNYDFWQNAIIGGLVISLVCSLLSVYVVLRRMAFIGQGISHSALGGFALGLLFFGGAEAAAIYVDATALVFCLIVAGFIAIVTRHTKISEDSAIGIFFVTSMALGAVIFRMVPGYNQDIYSFLFGSVLAMSRNEVYLIGGVGLGVMLPLILLQKELLYYTFDEQMAQVAGLRVNLLHYLLLALLSVTIILSSRLVGVLLVSAFLILPGAIAQLITQKFRPMILWAIFVGLFTTALGLFVCAITDWPSGASIVLLQFFVFLILFAFRKWQHALTVYE